MKRLILFIIRRKLRVRKYESFQFTNQKSNALYFFDDNAVWKLWNNRIEKSHVSINWLLDDDCEIVRL